MATYGASILGQLVCPAFRGVRLLDIMRLSPTRRQPWENGDTVKSQHDGTHRRDDERGGGPTPADYELIGTGREDDALIHHLLGLGRRRACVVRRDCPRVGSPVEQAPVELETRPG